MAAFTTLALIGLAAAAGAGTTKLLARGHSNADSATPGRTPHAQTDPNTVGTPAPPLTTPGSTAAKMKQASAASDRARRKATAGGTLLTGKPVSKTNTAAVLAPRSLIGY